MMKHAREERMKAKQIFLQWLNTHPACMTAWNEPLAVSAKNSQPTLTVSGAFHVIAHKMSTFRLIVSKIQGSSICTAKRRWEGTEAWVTCVKVLVCIVEAWMCSTTLSTSGLGPVTKPILSLEQSTPTWLDLQQFPEWNAALTLGAAAWFWQESDFGTF